MRLRRSCLAVPGSSDKMLAKAATLAADQVFLDLEDAVSPLEKVDARDRVVDALRTHDYSGKTRVVRVNGVTTRWCLGDVTAVVGGAGDRLDCIMVPKVEDAGQLHFIDHLLTQLETEHELPNRIGIEAQIENARGAMNIREIAQATPTAGDPDLRPRRLRREHGRRPAGDRVDQPRVPRRPVALGALADRDGGPRVWRAGDRRAVHRYQGHRRLPQDVPPRPADRLRRQVGAASRPRSRSPTRSSRRRRPSSTRPAGCSTPTSTRRRSSARARSCTRAR